MPKKTLLLLLFAAVLFDFTGCVSMSPQARRERAYRHYVQKQMKERRRAMARAQKAANRQLKEKMKLAQPSEPKITTSVEDVPSAPTSFAQPVVAPPSTYSDQVTPPITVSASGPIATESDNETPQP